MIHDEADPVIDFTWFYFIGKTKLNLSIKETGRLTLYTFNRLYQHYKDDWDMQMMMTAAQMTYQALYVKSQQDEEWF